MADLEYTVTNQGIATTKTSRLVSGTIGVYTVKFTFNNVWDGLEKWATFDPIPGTPYKQPLDANGECTIPGEVMGGVYLRIGVFGLAEGQAYPTIWASKLPLEEGCFVNVPPSDWPEPSPLLEDVVKVSEQTFTDAQKTQARTNIGAAGSAEMTTALAGKVDKPVGATEGNVAVIGSNNNIVDSGVSLSDILPTKSASGRLIKIYDGAEGMPLKSAILHINPRKNNGTVHPYERGVFNVRQNLLITGLDLRQQIKAYMPQCAIDQDAKTITISPGYSANAPIGYIDNAQYDDGISTVTVILTGHKNSGTNVTTPFRLAHGNGGNTANYADLTAPVTTKQTQIVAFNRSNINGFIKTNRGTQNYVLYYDESYIVEGEISSVAQVPEYVGEKIIRDYPVDVYAGDFNLLTGELAVCPTIESYNGETLTGEWFSSLDDYAPGTTPTTGAFVVDLAGEKTTYQLDPVNLHTLKGYNRIWADFKFYGYSNELEIVYCCDPALAIDEKAKGIKETIAPVEEGYTASQAYAVGSFLFVGDTLYKVTSEIASGATITPNTNVVATTVAEQLMALA